MSNKNKTITVLKYFFLTFLIIYFLGDFVIRILVKDLGKTAPNQTATLNTKEDSVNETLIKENIKKYTDSITNNLKKQIKQSEKPEQTNMANIKQPIKPMHQTENEHKDKTIAEIKDGTENVTENAKSPKDNSVQSNNSDSINLNENNIASGKDTAIKIPIISPDNIDSQKPTENKKTPEIPKSMNKPLKEELVDPDDFDDTIHGKLQNNDKPHEKVIVREKPDEGSRQIGVFLNDNKFLGVKTKKREVIILAKSKKAVVIQGKTGFWYKIINNNSSNGFVFGFYLKEVR